MPFSRRDFVEHALTLAGAALASSPRLTRAADTTAKTTVPPSEKVRVAVVGVNGQGSAHVGEWLQTPEAELVAICDVDPAA